VPNAALRYSPPAPEMADNKRAGGSLLSKLFPRSTRTRPRKNNESGDRSRQQLWVLRDNQPQAVTVTVGATDGIMTEILDGEVTEGMAFISEAVRAGK
jgi:HlyD family secretion protein